MDELWYKDAVLYELPVKAFQDGNDDGIGDFRGLTERLDYIQDLGVDCLWLLPFFPSPLRDDGYDISDYYDVSPRYGKMADFEAFLQEARRRNLRVIADLVVNHTSDQHAWFQEARRDPRSPRRNYYVWSDTDRKYRDARIIFVDTEKSNWTWDPEAKAYYWHRFFSHQPDLNYDNPEVQRAMLDVMHFWMDKGLDGFRCDAVPYLFEREGTSCENLPETHHFLRSLRAAIDARYRGKILLAEANQWPRDVRPYFGDGDEFHMAFHFPLMPRLFMAVRSSDRRPITDMFLHTPPIPETCQWCLFLRNHDELTLEMCTDPERDYMYYAYAQDPLMKLNIGIRRRLAPLLENDRRRSELLHSLLFSLPGTPIVYYGDEIGMGDNIHLGDRNGVRTPMQWSADRNAGFSRTDPTQLYSPVIADPTYGYQSVNVEAQLRTPSSRLHWMRRLIAARKRSRVFGRGTLRFLPAANTRVLAHLRQYQGETVLAVHNLAPSAEPVELDLREFRGALPVEMLGEARFPAVGDRPYFLSLGPYGYYWFRLYRPGPHAESYGIENAAL
jgi:maltose alpha-D-glucosyltransferase/alpha-amylase